MKCDTKNKLYVYMPKTSKLRQKTSNLHFGDVCFPFDPETDYNFPMLGRSAGFTGFVNLVTSQHMVCGIDWFEDNFVEYTKGEYKIPSLPISNPDFQDEEEYTLAEYLRSQCGYTAKEIKHSLSLHRTAKLREKS